MVVELLTAVNSRLSGVSKHGMAAGGALQRGWASLPEREFAEPVLPPFDHVPAPYTGPSKEEVYRLRKEHLSPGQQLTPTAPYLQSCHNVRKMFLKGWHVVLEESRICIRT